MPDRLRRADLHVHSSHSYDVADLPSLSPRALFERALGHPDPTRRMDWFALTDHNMMTGWEELARTLPESDRRLLIPAVEHDLLDPTIGFTIHVNLYLVDPDRYAELRRRVRTLDELLAFCRAHGILAQYNHPTWFEKSEFEAGLVNFALVPAIAERFAVLELNAGRSSALNRVTWALARDRDRVGMKAITATSDTHTGDVGIAWTAAVGDTTADWLANVWAGRSLRHAVHMSGDEILSAARSVIDAMLEPGQGGRVKRSAMEAGVAPLEAIAARVLGSEFVRRHGATRLALRFLLRSLAAPVVRHHLRHEQRLERAIVGSGLFQVPPQAAAA